MGLSTKKGKNPSVRLGYLIYVQEVKPWPPSQSLRSIRSVLIQWNHGYRNSGSTNPVVPSLGSGTIGDGKIVFNQSFRLPMKHLRQMSSKGGERDTLKKNCIEFNLYEYRMDKTVKGFGQLLGTAVVDLADHVAVKDTQNVCVPMNSKRSFSNTSQPVLSIKIQSIRKGGTSSLTRDNLGKEASTERHGGESVSRLTNEEHAEEAFETDAVFSPDNEEVVEDANSKASASAISPSSAAPIDDIVSGILDFRGILITFANFPYYLCDRTKHALVASFFLYTKHQEYARCNSELLDAGRLRILFSGPTGSRIYQEKLAMALAHHFGAKLLVLGNYFFPADLYTMGVGPSRDVLWTHFRRRATQSSSTPPQYGMNCHSFKRGDRVVYVGSNFGGLCSTNSPRGPTFGSLGEIVFLAQASYSKLAVRFDKPIHGGLDLAGQCKAGYGFYCYAYELCLDPATLKDFDKSITNNYLEATKCASRDSPLILFMKDVDKFVLQNSEAYLVIKYLINKLPEYVFVIGSHTPTENNKEKESYFGKYEKDKKLLETKISNLFPNQISIEMPEEEKQIAVLKHQFSKDSELIIANENIICLRKVLIQSGLDCEELEELSIVHQTLTYESAEKVVKWALGYQLLEYPQRNANANANLVLSSKSIEYGVNVLRETQPELKTSEKLVKDVVTENEFEEIILGEVIPPSETRVKFDDIGALEHVKDTLKELVMLPLQRPELFCKGQLRKPCKGILLFGPPGTGKTMLAKAIATEAGANFINISASTIFSKWFGEAEKYVKAVFSLAIKIAPSIIFVDEVDSLLGRRGTHEHEATRRVKNEFMVNWDGLCTKDGERVMVLAATNRPFDLDEAVIRRMPRRFMVSLPDAVNRTKILRLILEKEELSPDVDFDAISGMTDGYSGSDLKNLCVTAAYCPVREILHSEKQKNAVTVPDMEPTPTLKETSEIRPISMEDFKYAREQISASFSTESMNMNKLLQWNELYGAGGSVAHGGRSL